MSKLTKHGKPAKRVSFLLTGYDISQINYLLNEHENGNLRPYQYKELANRVSDAFGDKLKKLKKVM